MIKAGGRSSGPARSSLPHHAMALVRKTKFVGPPPSHGQRFPERIELLQPTSPRLLHRGSQCSEPRWVTHINRSREESLAEQRSVQNRAEHVVCRNVGVEERSEIGTVRRVTGEEQVTVVLHEQRSMP